MDTCPLCALPHTPGDLAWSSQHEVDGSITRICPTCTRAQLWLIEAGLTFATPWAPAAPVPSRRAA
ncbi:hypothetical protein [Pseudonocardia hydrocarbonoxydans]|uniref:Uncharacterized protein n=1 Tax=Pseudonocardia hydrocarbonoxydans TaxID=76726 RepID=A0A4Y3WFP2_9PSEU|nr:hypothetical protein [Pseudonocardia hydrocarbonoxydans]GEC17817.1 hypothetical protein PHY01_01000 [Pseudonocardia hydrocarbonoxydans]